MKKIYLLLCSLIALHNSATAQLHSPKLSPATKAYLLNAQALNQQQNLPDGYVYKKRADGKLCVSGIIKVNASVSVAVAEQIQAAQTTVGTKAGNIWTVQIPLEEVATFSQILGIDYIQLDEPLMPALDIARKTTRVDSAQAGYGLPQGYSGKGVLMGIIDFGFDYNHPTMYDTLGNKYRIIKAWEMNASGTPPSGFSYGSEITDTSLLKLRGTDNPVQTHGTGVAGLAAGSGYGSPTAGKYRGVAYESEMVLVGVRRDSLETQWRTGGFSDFIDGVHYLTQYAKSVGKPIVINISWGSHSGPHDGSSLVNQAFDTLAGAGKIIVMSAGNEGKNNLHLNKTFTATDSNISTFLDFTSKAYMRTWVDIWGDTSKTFCVKTTLYSKGIAGKSTGRVCISNSTKLDTLIAANGIDTCFVQTYTSASEYNMKPRVTINIFSKTTDSIGISVSGTSGTINMWDEYYYYGFPFKYASSFVGLLPGSSIGNANTTVSDMGAGKETILVGAYNSSLAYTDINGIPHGGYPGVVGSISYFSSKGPMIDGRIKPDICAPGLTIATSVNSLDTPYSEIGSMSGYVVRKFNDPKTSRNYYYAEFSGTSASAPIASGIVALLLQIDPTLTPSQIKTLLFQTAIVDAGTGIIPSTGNNVWGHGKINAYGAVRKLIQNLNTSSYTSAQKLDCVLFPNPSNDHFNLDLQSSGKELVSVSIVDLSGRTLLQQNWMVQAGQNIMSLDVHSLSKGIYTVLVKGAYSDIAIKAIIQ
jgi:minor extracellular serine protease Vpr